MKTNEERLQGLFAYLNSQTHVQPEEIPNIDLYMDQVTTFMEEHLKNTRRYEEDKVLTKTMINNYAKNNLLPPPVKEIFQEHMLMLIFIYYFKSLLSFGILKNCSVLLLRNILPVMIQSFPGRHLQGSFYTGRGRNVLY